MDLVTLIFGGMVAKLITDNGYRMQKEEDAEIEKWKQQQAEPEQAPKEEILDWKTRQARLLEEDDQY